jgi:RNA polymerase sigma factor (sigma-70 family)
MSLAPSVTHSTIPCNEHELVAATRRGDDRAFEQLYSLYRSRISAYILGMVGDHGRAEDIAQEVFISALRRLRNTEQPIAFKPWLYEIAKNACIDEFRRTRRTKEISLEADEESDRELESWRPGPDAAVADKQSLADLRGAFHGLSENHHKIIVMRELEGLSYDQIGDKLGMSRPMVESTLFRARKKLSEEYNELVSGRRCEHVQTLIADDQRRSLLKLGVRERRQLARHLAHCQTCRREARLAAIDESFFKAPKTLAGKIAALLPFPWLRRWRSHSSAGGEDQAVAASSHSYAAIQSLQVVARLADPSGPGVGFGRAAATAAAVAVAGIGGGVVTGAVGGGSPAATHPHPAIVGHPAASTSAATISTNARRQHAQAARPSSITTRTVSGRGGRSGSGSGSSTKTASTGAGGSSTAGKTASGAVTAVGNAASGAVHTITTTKPKGVLSTAPTLPKVKLPNPQLPNLTGGLPVPKLPTVTTPKLPTVSVPGVTLPDPNKVLGGILGGHGS